jgi:predicted pyridoxine 5'-phosphate oxidase superfamily flavin-nucleotide-binding protein
VKIPDKTKTLLDKIKTIAMATVTDGGVPNVVPMARKYWYGDDVLIIGDMFMKATRKNVVANGNVSICVWDDATGESYKLTGTGTYETSGEAVELANRELEKDKPGKKFKGVVLFNATHIYDTARGKNAGALIAEA